MLLFHENNMGFISWLTKDTKRSILNKYNGQKTFTVYMHGIVNCQKVVYREDNYEGYGVFGGKDYYVLVAEMNDSNIHTRDHGIDIAFRKGCKYPILTESPVYDGPYNQECKMCPNQGFI